MEAIKLAATLETPKVICDPNGTISIVGNSLPEDPFDFYRPIMNWVIQVEAENLDIELQLECMSTSSVGLIYSLLKLAKENTRVKNILVSWYTEENDEDGYEIGKDFEEILELPFRYYVFS